MRPHFRKAVGDSGCLQHFAGAGEVPAISLDDVFFEQKLKLSAEIVCCCFLMFSGFFLRFCRKRS